MRRLQNIPFDIQTYDVTFILADYVKGEHKFLSCIPSIKEDTCGLKESPLRQINSCRNGELEKKNMAAVFPSKIPKNYKLCPFNVGMATLFPYSMIPNKEKMKDLDRITEGNGSDIEMVKIIAKDFNATLNLFYIFRDEKNPYLHFEFLNYLLNKTLDACAGGLYHIYGDVVAYSGLYGIQSVIWVYTVDRAIHSWQSFGHKVTDVYYFFIVYLIYSVIWTLVRKYDKNSVSFVETIVSGWGALLGTTSLQDPKSLKQKILNIAYLVMSLHLSAYIGAQIYSYLTILGPPQTYKTVEELKVSGKKPYLQKFTKYFVKDKNYEEFANTSGDCKDFRHCENTILANTGATLLLSAYLLPFQAETAINDEARVLGLQESVLTVWHEMIMRKDFALEKFQDIVSRLFEAGICDKLYNEAIGITVVDKAKITNKNILANSYSCTGGCEITLVQMGGAFYLWLFGCLLSLVVFLVEVVYEWLKKCNTVYLA
ncbi:uncharacterized protein LOC121735630 [Aricia agestis]|uniref:uncharacterized protein LOC121735630 n=1 Tax=Aricia agestis TaxID=91739 RepID=UPI001C204476|nr:uncharacterized protein LOC121735630 [Aricia agestis]